MKHKTLLDQWLKRLDNDITFEGIYERAWDEYDRTEDESIMTELREMDAHKQKLNDYLTTVDELVFGKYGGGADGDSPEFKAYTSAIDNGADTASEHGQPTDGVFYLESLISTLEENIDQGVDFYGASVNLPMFNS